VSEVVERDTARVAVLDEEGRVLLLTDRTPFDGYSS